MRAPVLILPGYGGSGPEHWQTLWERAHPECRRVQQRDWESPELSEWMVALQTAMHAVGPGAVLVAHSLACLLVAHWARHTRLRPAGALLVAPPDPESPVFPENAVCFVPVPLEPLPFPSVVVGSSDDPFAKPEYTARCAKAWGARLVDVGPRGHINAASGLGEWGEGWEWLEKLRVES